MDVIALCDLFRLIQDYRTQFRGSEDLVAVADWNKLKGPFIIYGVLWGRPRISIRPFYSYLFILTGNGVFYFIRNSCSLPSLTLLNLIIHSSMNVHIE